MMTQTIGQVIRRLRKERNFTQEELAEQLNISAQAVSKWENGTSMPDISQVVPLASVFGVTTDVLFGVEGTNAAEEAYRIVSEAEEIKQYGELSTYLAAYDHLLEGLQKYPNNLVLLNNCVGFGLSLCLPENGWLYAAERADEIAAETERQAGLIISYSRSPSDILRAHQVLLFLYSSQGEYGKAAAEAEHFPERTDFTLHTNMARVYECRGEWEEVIRHLGIDNSYAIQTLEDNLARLGKAYSNVGRYDQAIYLYESWFRTMEAMFGERFPAFHDFDSGDCYLLLAQAYLASGDKEKAMENVEKSVRFYLDIIRPTKKIRLAALRENPPLTVHGITDIFISVPVMKVKLTEKLDSPELEPLRDSERFRALRDEVDSL
ncbi:MAG: helix-turn-helix transcriptional regulator [Clostridia bacterium]|nr:helix-turn-helix transcriptional regulator [Clostridia bacterium]